MKGIRTGVRVLSQREHYKFMYWDIGIHGSPGFPLIPTLGSSKPNMTRMPHCCNAPCKWLLNFVY